jgi:hypothetical protein
MIGKATAQLGNDQKRPETTRNETQRQRKGRLGKGIARQRHDMQRNGDEVLRRAMNRHAKALNGKALY